MVLYILVHGCGHSPPVYTVVSSQDNLTDFHLHYLIAVKNGGKNLRKQFVFVVTHGPQAGCHIKGIILLTDEAHHMHWTRMLCKAR